MQTNIDFMKKYLVQILWEIFKYNILQSTSEM